MNNIKSYELFLITENDNLSLLKKEKLKLTPGKNNVQLKKY